MKAGFSYSRFKPTQWMRSCYNV